MKSYCPNCGGATVYSGAKPKFCSVCGNALSALAKNDKQKNYVVHEDVNIDVEEELERLDISNMEGLEFEIEHSTNNKVTFGEIMKAASDREMEGNIDVPKTKGIKYNKNKVMKELKREAGTLRKKKDA